MKLPDTPQHGALHEVMSQRAADFGHRRAFTFQGTGGDESITFSELDRRARAVAATLQAVTTPGDRALLLFPAGLDFIISFVGCLHAGVLAVPTTYPKPRRPMPRLAAIARDCDAAAVLTNSATLGTLDTTLTQDLLPISRWLAADEVDPAAADRLRPVAVSADDLAFLQYTSGSTSEPKGVMVSHGNLLHNLEMIRRGFGLEPAGQGGAVTGVFWLPAYHDMGLIGGILESIYLAGHSVLMSPAAFLQRPLGWLEAMSSYGATVSGAPNFAYELCVSRSTEEQRMRLDLTNWRLAFCGAEPIRPETLQRFAEAFAVAGFRQDAFYPCFGLAEGTLLAAGGYGPSELVIKTVDRQALMEHRVRLMADGAADGPGQPLVGCGHPLLDQEIVIVDPERRVPCDAQRVGEIWLRGPSIARGYWNQPEETAKTFNAYLAGEPRRGPFLRTGDLGFVYDGQLYVTGRVKDVIIIRGRNHYPQDLEQTVGDAHEALRPDSGAVFTVNGEHGQEQLVVVHEIDRHYRQKDFGTVMRAVRRAIAEVHELEVAAVVLIRHASLPRTTSGKAQRHLCRSQFLNGELRVLSQWKRVSSETNGGSAPPPATRGPRRLNQQETPLTPAEIDRLAERVESWLLAWLVERAAIPQEEVHRDKPFAEYGLDSLTAVELSQELEDWLGVEVAPTVAWNYPTPATLSAYLARAAAGSEEPAGVGIASIANIPEDEFSRMLAEVEALGEEDIARLLGAEAELPGPPSA